MATTLHPQNENELADMVRDARARCQTCEILGHGTRRAFGRPVVSDRVLDLSALSGIVSHEADELVITVRAATPLAEIESVLAAKSQKLGFDPADWSALFAQDGRLPTIAGAVSADASGSARLRYGAARDHLLGFRAVNGLGEIYKAGSHVVKNVTGFDLPKLVCGALGTLGPLSELTLRVVPRAGRSVTLIAADLTQEAGLEALRLVWAGPFEPTGLAYVPGTAAADGHFAGAVPAMIGRGAALLRVEGSPEPLADKLAALKTLVPGLSEIADGDAAFAQLGSGTGFCGRNGDVWRLFVPPAQAPLCAAELASAFWYADWAGGVIWFEDTERRDLHALAARFGGFAILTRAGDRARREVFPPQNRVQAALTARVKAAFDPQGLFNPGRMYEEM